MNVLYVVPDLKKVSGGPRTRINMFKSVFVKNGNLVIEKGNKFTRSLFPRKINRVYIESATNRISIIDFISLLFLRLYAKEVTVFIRDIYIELFPEEYQTVRSKLTLILNKFSNFYLTLIATSMVFPTCTMGAVFFEKNKMFPKRSFTDLPPGTVIRTEDRAQPRFKEKLGILYLGSTKYTNSGFDKFVGFSDKYSENYNFYVLSGDENLKRDLAGTSIFFNSVNHSEIADFIAVHNIAYALHTRPRNEYDDLTFPIKVLDFVSLQLPFFTEKHIPLVNLLGDEYKLFLDVNDFDKMHQTIQKIDTVSYESLMVFLKEITLNNTYDERYNKLLSV